MINKEVKDFCGKHSMTIDQFYGREKIEGNLNLNSITELPEGFNPKVGWNLHLKSVTKLPKGFSPTVKGGLDLRSTKVLPEGFSPTVGDFLYLNSITELPEGFNPTVAGSLHLRSLTKLPKDFNLAVGGSLYLNSITELPKGFSPTVRRCLDLRSVKQLPKDFNPIVGGDLLLDSIKKISEDFNITVGGDLHMNKLTEVADNFNPTIDGSLYLPLYNSVIKDIKCKVIYRVYCGNCLTYYVNHKLPILSWENGKYIKVDGVFCEVIHKRGDIRKCKYLNTDEIFYVVSDGNDTYAHGYTIKEAQSDLLFKLSERNVDDYRNLTLDSVLKHDEAVICYRVITGACKFGTNDFLDNVLGDNAKESYTINEIIQLTKNQYGNAKFKEFFNV